MGQGLGQLRISWNILRALSIGQAIATFSLILPAIPTGFWAVISPIFLVGCVAAILTVALLKVALARLTMLLQGTLFAAGLLSAVFGVNGEAYAPLLLLAFLMVIGSEHILSMTLAYSAQFSGRANRAVAEFNAPVLRLSLGLLYARFAWDGIVFGGAFILSLAVAAISAVSATVTILSDPSLYVILLSLSLAFLFLSKDEQ
jgi:hypothetical protein